MFRAVVLLLLAFPSFADSLSGTWLSRFTAPGGAKRELLLALKVDGSRVEGETETPTRLAPLVEGTTDGTSFKAIAQSIWDGKLARRPIEGKLEGEVLKVRIQAWPGGPMADYEMRQVSKSTELPKAKPLPLPELVELKWDGLAKTPPMGWNTWNKFACRVSDQLIRETADSMAATGMRDAGYQYINIDDCWQGERDAKGNIQPDTNRFPDMKALADYVHSKGLKLGIYSSPGPKTCAGYEGSYGYEEQDARTYAAWGIDYLKYDWCSAGKLYRYDEMRAAFQKMGTALRATGRPIVYSICQYGLADVWEWGPKAGGHLWRTTEDIGDNWKTVAEIGFEKQEGLAKWAGPGRWNDPDMLEVGNGGMTADEYRTHMSLWALLAAPLLAGNDLRSMTAETKGILLNKEVIAVDQDTLGKQGYRVWKEGTQEIWTKPLADGSLAIGLFERGEKASTLALDWAKLGLANPKRLRDLWAHRDVKAGSFQVPAHGVVLIRAYFR
jgi:alpha-galactosidase